MQELGKLKEENEQCRKLLEIMNNPYFRVSFLMVFAILWVFDLLCLIPNCRKSLILVYFHTVNRGFQPLKSSIFDVWLGFECASGKSLNSFYFLIVEWPKHPGRSLEFFWKWGKSRKNTKLNDTSAGKLQYLTVE